MKDLLCTEEALCHPMGLSTDPITVLQCMLLREAQYDPSNATYLATIQQHGMEVSWRRKICQWMFETGNAFELTKDTVACAIIFMDRYLSTTSVDKVMLQLVSMISMLIASKMHDHQPISMEEMELLSQNKFTRHEIRRAESEIIQFLTWQFNPPTSFTFARDFIHCLQYIDTEIQMVLEDHVTYLLQEATLDYLSLRFLHSTLGIASVQVIWNAKHLGRNSILYDALHAVGMGNDPGFMDCLHWLRALYEAKHKPQTLFVSVELEASKMAESGRSISPTSVDHLGEFNREDYEDIQGKLRPHPELERPVPTKKSRHTYEQ